MTSKKEAHIKSAISRLKKFRTWFSKKVNQKNVNLASWVSSGKYGDPIDKPSRATIQRCGGTACLGGWLVLSPMYRKYREEKGLSTSDAIMNHVSTTIGRHIKTMYRFVGYDITRGSCDWEDSRIFAGAVYGDVNDKDEAIRRLDHRIDLLETLVKK